MLDVIGGLLVDKGVGLIGDLFSKGADKGIEMIGGVIKDATGIDITSEEQVRNLTPEQVVQLQQIEKDHQADIIYYLVTTSQQAVDNTHSARQMHMESMKQGGIKGHFTNILAMILMIFFIVYVGCITFMDIPEQNAQYVHITLGFMLGTVAGTVVNFYFGSAMPHTKPEDVDIKNSMSTSK